MNLMSFLEGQTTVKLSYTVIALPSLSSNQAISLSCMNLSGLTFSPNERQ